MNQFCTPLAFFLFHFFSSLVSAQNNVTLLSTVTFTNQTLANVWGYSSGGSEYALVGGFDGTIIIDITDPLNPTTITTIDGPNSQWREIKTYEDYAYVVSEGGAGVQIIDLSDLPGNNLDHKDFICNVPGFGNVNKAHALHIDETAGFLYAYGTNLIGGKPIVMDLTPDPYNPTYAGMFNAVGYAHDGYVDNDMMYAGHIFAGKFSIVDFSDKSAPDLLGTQNTPGAFTHNTWLNGNTLFTTDEVSNSFLTAYDISDPDAITELDRIRSNPGSGVIVHNTYILNNFAVTSWYKDGFTIVDVTRPINMIQVGNYDTYPNGNGNGFEGCWGVYPYFPSGTIIASNIKKFGTNDGELMIFSADYVRACYLEGTVRDINNNPLNNVKIEILTTPVAENTGANGQYKTGLATPGPYTVRVSKLGYITQDIAVDLVAGSVVTLDVILLLAPLPVELTRFQVRSEDYKAWLLWETASEYESKGFEVQHSINVSSWETIGFVEGKGAAARYEFRTNELNPGVHYFRLKQLDLDGTFKYTDWVSTVIEKSGLSISLVPNLIDEQTTLNIHTARPGEIYVELFSADMQSMGKNWTFSVEKDFEAVLSLGQLPVGKYYLLAQSGQERAAVPLLKN